MSLSTLDSAVKMFETFPKETKIQGLISSADSLPRLAPKEGENWDVEDVRKDHECLDVVGLYVESRMATCKLAATVGKEVTTLTRALTSLFVENLSGETRRTYLSVEASIISAHCRRGIDAATLEHRVLHLAAHSRGCEIARGEKINRRVRRAHRYVLWCARRTLQIQKRTAPRLKPRCGFDFSSSVYLQSCAGLFEAVEVLPSSSKRELRWLGTQL